MDFEWRRQRMYRDTVIRFAQRELNDDVIRRDAEDLSREAWRSAPTSGFKSACAEGIRR
jgi:hypothetical protein